MIISIHQPHFLPWVGYFNKVLRSDTFVWLHSVQYRKNYYQNRTKIKNINAQALWLTLPVHASLGMLIDEVTIADTRWRERVRKTVEQCYRKAPHFAECWQVLSAAIDCSSDNLSDVNFKTFSALLQLLGNSSVRVELVRNIDTASVDPTRRLVEICTALGGTTYIAGKGGHNYLRVEDFKSAGIDVVWQEYDADRVVYKQLGDNFVPALSIIDCLFNVGPAAARELVLKAWAP
jgi:hypothetical protein